MVLATAIVLITAALVFYSVGVWAEHLQRVLKWWHVVFFALGLSCDASGTLTMIRIAASSGSTGGSLLTSIMSITGTIALALMVIHLAWAIVVLVRNRESEKTSFHRFSLVVWSIWLIPYIAGALSANIR